MRVTLTTILGYLFALPLPRLLGIDPKWGVAGLTASGRYCRMDRVCSAPTLSKPSHRSHRLVGVVCGQTLDRGSCWLRILVGTFKLLLGEIHPIPLAALVLGGYGMAYFAVAYFLELSESRAVFNKMSRLLRLSK